LGKVAEGWGQAVAQNIWTSKHTAGLPFDSLAASAPSGPLGLVTCSAEEEKKSIQECEFQVSQYGEREEGLDDN
jgi:hypothetical protein